MPNWIKYGLLGTLSTYIVMAIIWGEIPRSPSGVVLLIGFIGGALTGTKKKGWKWGFAGGLIAFAVIGLVLFIANYMGFMGL